MYEMMAEALAASVRVRRFPTRRGAADGVGGFLGVAALPTPTLRPGTPRHVPATGGPGQRRGPEGPAPSTRRTTSSARGVYIDNNNNNNNAPDVPAPALLERPPQSTTPRATTATARTNPAELPPTSEGSGSFFAGCKGRRPDCTQGIFTLIFSLLGSKRTPGGNELVPSDHSA